MKTNSARTLAIQPRLRVRVGDKIALGPGKVELLELVQKAGSIREAAHQMGMSYMRAWTLIQTMNCCFQEPVVRTRRGGETRGGACLTETGQLLLALYQRMETECLAVTKGTRSEMAALLKKSA